MSDATNGNGWSHLRDKILPVIVTAGVVAGGTYAVTRSAGEDPMPAAGRISEEIWRDWDMRIRELERDVTSIQANTVHLRERAEENNRALAELRSKVEELLRKIE